jgi:hypothetical protein
MPADTRVAEREGFEPPIRLPVCRISSAVLSTTQPPLRGLDIVRVFAFCQTARTGIATQTATEQRYFWALRRDLATRNTVATRKVAHPSSQFRISVFRRNSRGRCRTGWSRQRSAVAAHWSRNEPARKCPGTNSNCSGRWIGAVHMDDAIPIEEKGAVGHPSS